MHLAEGIDGVRILWCVLDANVVEVRPFFKYTLDTWPPASGLAVEVDFWNMFPLTLEPSKQPLATCATVFQDKNGQCFKTGETFREVADAEFLVASIDQNF